MTREEALVKVRGYLTNLLPIENYDEVEEIMLALEQQSTCNQLATDCISRNALLKKLQKVATESWKMKLKCNAETVWNQCIDYIKDAPSVEPKRKTAKWINVDGSTNSADCSCCGNRGRAWMNYCYLCGAKMEGGVTYNAED